MERWRQRLRSISWRLILSYLLVTLVVELTIGGTLAVGQAIHDAQQSGTLAETTLEKQGTAQLASALEQAPPDPEALRFLVAIPLFDDLQRADQHLTLVMLLDRQGQVLAAAACGRQLQLSSATAGACATAATSKAGTLLASPQVQTAISTQLRSVQPSGETTGTTQTGEHFLAVPVLGNEKRPVGVVVAAFAGSPGVPGPHSLGLSEVLAALANAVQPEGLWLLLLVSVVGTLTGGLFSRNLTRRLRRIMQAAESWSQGEFEREVRDSARDELSQLAHNLNMMASHLQALLATRQELAVVEERRRLQRDLHDAVKQHLFAAKMHIAATRATFKEHPDQAYQHVVEAEQSAGQAQQELTALIEALRPVALATSTFMGAVEEQCQAWSRRTGIPIEVRKEMLTALPPAVEEALFRVVQEALTNIALHSEATEVLLHLAVDEQTLVLTLLDNGQGFAVQAAVRGIGLQSMRERMAAVGGALEIQSTASGTCIEARVPLHKGAGSND